MPTTDEQYPRGRETSNALVEVRTVLSRAETALETLQGYPADRERWADVPGFLQPDPDEERMIGALIEVRNLLDKWRRTGRPRKESRG